MTLKQLSARPFRTVRGDVPVITPVKNERVLVPHFLRHHRAIGVTSFIMIDNGSTDGTVDYLLEQKDVTLFQCLDPFREANHGMDWINELLANLCDGLWTVYLDCDEHMVFEDCETRTIQALAAELTAEQADTVNAFMLDLYPEGDFRAVAIAEDDDLKSKLDRFDSDYVFRERPMPPWKNVRPQFQVLGGPRCRILSSLDREAARGWFSPFVKGKSSRFVYAVPEAWLDTLAKVWPHDVPQLHKRPMNFVRDGFRFNNSHSSSNNNLHGSLICLLHYKFCDELNKRLDLDFIRKNNYNRGLGHQQLATALDRWPGDSLVYEGTRQYRTSADLMALGLIGPDVAGVWAEGDRRARRVSASGTRIL